MGSNNRMITSTKDMLNSRFDMKDIGRTNIILGIKIKRLPNSLILSQLHYANKILNKFGKDNYSMARTPIDIS